MGWGFILQKKPIRFSRCISSKTWGRFLPASESTGSGGPRGEIMKRCDKFQAAEVVGSCCAFLPRSHQGGVPGNIKMPWWNPWWSTSDRSETDDSGNGSDLALANFKRCNTPNDTSSRLWVLLYFLVALGSNPPENLLFMKCLSYIIANVLASKLSDLVRPRAFNWAQSRTGPVRADRKCDHSEFVLRKS